MNFRNMLRVGAFCLSTVGMFSNISAMNENPSKEEEYPKWPTMAVDGTPEHPEGEHLAHYHATAEKRGFRWHMPKDAQELDHLYKLHKGNKLDMSSLERLWAYILFDIEEEIVARCLDGDLFFIDNYLSYLDNFIISTSSYPDNDFVSGLYVGNFLDTLENGLWNTVIRVEDYISSSKKKDLAYTHNSTHLTYVVSHIDKQLADVGKKRTDFFDTYCELYLDTNYKKSTEFKNFLRSVGRIINEGVKIDLL